MDFSPLLPDTLPVWAAAGVVIAAFFTSALTAAFGIGGGLALLAVMSTLLPAPAVIPVHGVAQIGSNASRFYLQRRETVWPIVLWFAGGAVIGAMLGGRLAIETPVWALRGGVAVFILYTLWGPRPKSFSPGVKTFFSTGIVATFLTMFFGATGPLVATMLSATDLKRLNFVATHAACMVFQHGLKIIAFGVLGFAYVEWAAFIIAILLAGYLGAVAGTRYLRAMPEQTFKRCFTMILTGIAIYLLIAAAIDFRTG